MKQFHFYTSYFKTGSKTWKKGSHENEIVTGNGITVEVCGGDVVTQKVSRVLKSNVTRLCPCF